MSDPANPAPPPRNNWGWIFFFTFVVVASVGVTGFMIWFNLSIQLKPEMLEAAQKRWEEQNIQDYDMVYTVKSSPGDNLTTFKVEVRKGEVKHVLMNGEELTKSKDQKDDPRIFRSMTALFRDMQRFMDNDTKPGAPRVYVTAAFDEKTGRLGRYVRRVMGTQQRVEILVTAFKRRD